MRIESGEGNDYNLWVSGMNADGVRHELKLSKVSSAKIKK